MYRSCKADNWRTIIVIINGVKSVNDSLCGCTNSGEQNCETFPMTLKVTL